MIRFPLGNFTVGSGKLFFILGPCGLEEEDFAWRMARALKKITDRPRCEFCFQGFLRQSQPNLG
jgi:2-dehydro-3-deoxyphosphooctonate aldolase (KDO 8-P synthase)